MRKKRSKKVIKLREHPMLMCVGDAALFLNINAQTLRRWDREGSFKPTKRANNGFRLYDVEKLQKMKVTLANERSLK